MEMEQRAESIITKTEGINKSFTSALQENRFVAEMV